MALIHPITLPVTPSAQSVELSIRTAVGRGRNPFDQSVQLDDWGAQKIFASISLRPMSRAQGEPWLAALLAAQLGDMTFLLGPVGDQATPRGPAGGTPLVSGAHAAGVSILKSSGWPSGGQLVVNGSFPSNISSWTTDLNGSTGGSIAWAAPGVMRLTQGSNSVWMRAYQAVTLAAGTIYSLAADRAAIVGGGDLYIGISANSADGIPEIATLYWSGTEVGGKAMTFSVATGGTYYFKIREGSPPGNSSDADSCSILLSPLLQGDWLQVGSGASSRLHKLLEDLPVDINGSSFQSYGVTLCPELRAALVDGAAIVVASPKGLFQLSENEQKWLHQPGAILNGITFLAEESI